jgi:hypothetical protein
MIYASVKNAYVKKIERGYNFLCWAIDLHGTIALPSYDKDEEIVEFYPGAIEALRYMSESDAHRLILWTSTHPHKYDMVLAQLGEFGVHFDYINENPEFKSNSLCDFSEKFAFDILLDDKAGFVPDGNAWAGLAKMVQCFDFANMVFGRELVVSQHGMMESITKYSLVDQPEKTAIISGNEMVANGVTFEGDEKLLLQKLMVWFAGGELT